MNTLLEYRILSSDEHPLFVVFVPVTLSKCTTSRCCSWRQTPDVENVKV